MNVAHLWELRCNVGCVIGRTVIDKNNFILGIVQFTQRLKARRKGASPIVRTHNHRDERRPRQRQMRDD